MSEHQEQTKLLLQLIIYGQPVSMKNNRRLILNRRTGKPMFIKSKNAIQYEKDFLKQILPKHKLNIDHQIKVIVDAYYKSRRPDLDCELIYDCLQKNGIVKNDRLIIQKVAYKRLDKENPRVEILIMKADK